MDIVRTGSSGKSSGNAARWSAALSVFACGNCVAAIDGALSKIADAMQVSSSAALYSGSIASLVSCISSIVTSSFAGKKVSYRTTALVAVALMLVGGILPFFAVNFPMLLLLRAVFGWGFGMILCIQNPLANKLFTGDPLLKVIGIGTALSFFLQCVMQLLGGVLADIDWRYTFFTYVLLVVPFGISIGTIPKIDLMPVETAEKKEKEKLPGMAVLLAVMMFFIGMTLAPLLLGGAFYVKRMSDSAVMASVVALMFSVGNMIGGLLFSRSYSLLKRKSYAVYLLIGALGVILGATARNIPVLCIGFFLGGLCMASLITVNMTVLSSICSERNLGFASSLMLAAMNLGVFLCSSWESLIGRMTGDPLYMPLYIAAVLFVVLAVVTFFRSPVSKESQTH